MICGFVVIRDGVFLFGGVLVVVSSTTIIAMLLFSCTKIAKTIEEVLIARASRVAFESGMVE